MLPNVNLTQRHYACWANNHNGWAKLKKMNRRLAKRKIAREIRKDIQNE